MYGDCQVMSNMGGNMVSSETLFSSSVGNPSFNFIPAMPFHSFSNIIPKEESGLMGMGNSKEEMESGSGSEQAEDKSGNEQETSQQPPKKKRYHRHTAHQIQEMEALFRVCPHPDDKQRMKLSQDLGLKPRQVKFWFQNRRTQMKAQQDRADNIILRAENESLKDDNYRLQAQLRNLICPNCGGPAVLGDISFGDLRLENARLRDELERACCIASRYSGRPVQAILGPDPALLQPSLDLDMNIYSRQYPDPLTACTDQMLPMAMFPEVSSFTETGLLLLEEEKAMAKELALSSMNELVQMCRTNEPLWIKNKENGREVLNFEEHSKMFHWPRHSSESRTEATRDTTVVIMNSITLVDAFLDGNKWMDLFPSIVARAKTVQIFNAGVSGPSGSLHLMFAELQVLSPLVPTREAYFLRYCEQNPVEGTWAVVDFPIDSCFQQNNFQPSFPIYKRRPSGCIIQDMPNGYSRVTWVEQAEVEEKPVHQIFSELVYSGIAFGARRWLSVLQRQCERVASQLAKNIPDMGVCAVISTVEARKNLMILSQRMVTTFCGNISSCNGQLWTALSESCEDSVRITQRNVTELGQPNGVIVCAVSTTWLPFSHSQVFDLLRDEHRRSQLDVLSNGHSLQEVAHIANGPHPGNSISLLRINVASNSSQNVELMLQESCTDPTGSIVVYTTINVESANKAMNGGDPFSIPLLPLGFVIIPMPKSSTTLNETRDTTSTINCNSGCLLTVGLQALASTIPSAKLNLSTVNAINDHLRSTLHQITAALNSPAINSDQSLPLDQQPTVSTDQ